MSLPGLHTSIPSHMLLPGLSASPRHHPVKSMFILQNSDPTELTSPPQALWWGWGLGSERLGLSWASPTQAPSARLAPQRAASCPTPGVMVFRVGGWRQGSAELERRPRSRWLRHLAACSVKDRAGMSEFPWEWAEASKQLGERVTRPVGLPARWAGWTSPPHRPKSHAWTWTTAPVPL